MQLLLSIARGIDRLNLTIGKYLAWVALLVALISAANAVSRKFFESSSNAWLELQWYLFGALFLLSSGYTLLRNGHVRVDILASKLSRRKQIGIEIFGTIFFLMPAFCLITWYAWPMFWESWISNEQSSNAGGLVRWPVKLLIPVGLSLLLAAAVSHLIKCVGYLRGLCPDPMQRDTAESDEVRLARELAEEQSKTTARSPGHD